MIEGYNDDDYGKNKIVNKKAKGTKKCAIKRELMFENYKESLFDDKIILRSQQRFRSNHHRVYTEEVNKIALSSNDDKRIQTYDKVTTYPYGTNVFKICENKMKMRMGNMNMQNEICELKIDNADKDKDKNIPKTMIEDKDKDKTMAKIKDKDEYIDVSWNKSIQVLRLSKLKKDKKNK